MNIFIFRKEVFSNFFLFFSFFFMGMYQFNLSLTFFILFFLLIVNKNLYFIVNKNIFISFGLVCFGVLMMYIIAIINGVYTYNKFNEIYVVLIFLFFIFSVYFFINKNNYYAMVGLIWGVGIYSLYCLYFTKYEIGQVSAYGKVWNPFIQDYENSPKHAINLTILAAFCFSSLKEYHSLFLKIIYIIVILLSTYFGFYSGSRIFFLLLTFSFIWFMFDGKMLFKFLFLFFVIMMIFFNFNFLDFLLFDRLLSEGLDSPRFHLYKLGLENIFYYPFGGYNIDFSVYKTHWNHNLFLDILRISGIIPFLFIFMFYIYNFYFIYKNNKNINKKLIFLFLVSFILLMQDVFFEGHYMFFLLNIVISLSILVSARGYNFGK